MAGWIGPSTAIPFRFIASLVSIVINLIFSAQYIIFSVNALLSTARRAMLAAVVSCKSFSESVAALELRHQVSGQLRIERSDSDACDIPVCAASSANDADRNLATVCDDVPART